MNTFVSWLTPLNRRAKFSLLMQRCLLSCDKGTLLTHHQVNFFVDFILCWKMWIFWNWQDILRSVTQIHGWFDDFRGKRSLFDVIHNCHRLKSIDLKCFFVDTNFWIWLKTWIYWNLMKYSTKVIDTKQLLIKLLNIRKNLQHKHNFPSTRQSSINHQHNKSDEKLNCS